MEATQKQIQAIKNMNAYLGERNIGLKTLSIEQADLKIKELIQAVKDKEEELWDADWSMPEHLG